MGKLRCHAIKKKREREVEILHPTESCSGECRKGFLFCLCFAPCGVNVCWYAIWGMWRVNQDQDQPAQLASLSFGFMPCPARLPDIMKHFEYQKKKRWNKKKHTIVSYISNKSSYHHTHTHPPQSERGNTILPNQYKQHHYIHTYILYTK